MNFEIFVDIWSGTNSFTEWKRLLILVRNATRYFYLFFSIIWKLRNMTLKFQTFLKVYSFFRIPFWQALHNHTPFCLGTPGSLVCPFPWSSSHSSIPFILVRAERKLKELTDQLEIAKLNFTQLGGVLEDDLQRAKMNKEHSK